MEKAKKKTIRVAVYNGAFNCLEDIDMPTDEYVAKFKEAVEVMDRLIDLAECLPVAAYRDNEPAERADSIEKCMGRMERKLSAARELLRAAYGEALVRVEEAKN